MNTKQFCSLLGFLFIAVWLGPGLGAALLCLLGAIVVYGAVAFYRRELDLADLQRRMPRTAPVEVHRPAKASRVS